MWDSKLGHRGTEVLYGEPHCTGKLLNVLMNPDMETWLPINLISPHNLHLPAIVNEIYSQCLHVLMRLKTLDSSSSHSRQGHLVYGHFQTSVQQQIRGASKPKQKIAAQIAFGVNADHSTQQLLLTSQKISKNKVYQ